MKAKMLLATTAVKRKAIIWTISGADCSGGAGIAADIKTGHNLGVEVCHLITANTVQNSQRLVSVYPVDTAVLDQQAAVLLYDKPPQVIKVGLLVNQAQVQWLTTLLRSLKSRDTSLQVVYDPVGQASVGGELSQLTPESLLSLLPLIDVITPNLLEAQQLSDLSTTKPALLAEQLLKTGVNAVIVKGGHEENSGSKSDVCSDHCWQKTRQPGVGSLQKYSLLTNRINSNYSHGGGCSFATALASFIAHGHLLRDAFTLAKAFINQGLRAQENNCDYYGAFEQGQWPRQKQDFPTVRSDLTQKYVQLNGFKSLGLKKHEKLGLYPVVDSLDWLARLLPLNVNIIQLRLKSNSVDELEHIIAQAVALAADYSCRLFINDHWQLAIKHGAYGVHLGQEDLATADLHEIAAAGLRLGISTHGCYEFLLAQQLQPSYLAIGAIYETKTKDMSGQIQGLATLKQTLTLASTIPVVAIGGINIERAKSVWKTGVDGVAVVTAISEAENPEQAVTLIQQQLD